MGTPMACIYATLYYAWKETYHLLPKYKRSLPFYGHFIDNVFGVWVPGRGKTFNELCEDMNEYGPNILKWIPSPLTKSVVMLDLTITINKLGVITHTTFQKDMNLYAYVPKSSSHLPGTLRGLVISQIL